jgi:glycosyltransferase involved in cell wall biosynthesis
LGYQSRINGLYRMSDVALVPTRFAGESFPLSITQALREGTPVIATRIGEIPNMLEGPEGTGGILLEERRDTELFIGSLQEAMAAMLVTSERERYARIAEERGKVYSMDKVAGDYTIIYDELLEARELPTVRQHV